MISSFNILDIILVLIVFLSILLGIWKGFIRELFSLVFFILAVVLSFSFYQLPGNLLNRYLKSRDLSNFVGFITIFVLVVIVGILVTYWLRKLFTLGPFKAIDRVLGGVFGLIRGILIASIIVFALVVFPVRKDLVVKSRLSPYVMKTIDLFIGLFPGKYQEKIEAMRKGKHD